MFNTVKLILNKNIIIAFLVLSIVPRVRIVTASELMEAVRNGDLFSIRELFEDGVDINEKDNEGHTPLLVAAAKGYKNVVELLLQNGAERDAQDSDGNTALMIAAEHGTTKTLNAQGFNDVNSENGYGESIRSVYRGGKTLNLSSF